MRISPRLKSLPEKPLWYTTCHRCHLRTRKRNKPDSLFLFLVTPLAIPLVTPLAIPDTRASDIGDTWHNRPLATSRLWPGRAPYMMRTTSPAPHMI